MTNVFAIIKNFLFPPHCLFCDSIMELNSNSAVCADCSASLNYCRTMLTCGKCGKPVVSYGKKRLCMFCLQQSPLYFDRIVSVFPYKSLVRDGIQRYKGHNLQCNAAHFARYIADRVEEEYGSIEFDLLCCAPSSSDKKRERGFDGVELIAQKVSRITGVPMKHGVLKKIIKTRNQTGLKYRERLENLHGSMEVESRVPIKGKTILLVDDVCTTRATIIECSRALKTAGAKSVFAVTIGTTENNYN